METCIDCGSSATVWDRGTPFCLKCSAARDKAYAIDHPHDAWALLRETRRTQT